MTDVSKAIYSGDWELYPKDGKVTIQDFEHCKIVLTDAEADEVCELLIERKRRKMDAPVEISGGKLEVDGLSKDYTLVARVVFTKQFEIRLAIAKLLLHSAAHILGCGITLDETAAIAEEEKYPIEYLNEDELPEGIPDEVFSAMYACSEVDFVRVYPYITIDGHKRFLIELPEVEE